MNSVAAKNCADISKLKRRSENSEDSPRKVPKKSKDSALAASRTKLHRAVLKENSTSVRHILRSEPHLIDKKDRDGNTALHLAAKHGLKGLKTLLDAGANSSLQNRAGFTPLHCALVKNRTDSALVLLSYNVKTDLQNDCGRTALHFAAEREHLAVVKKLLDAGANTRLQDSSGNTPLHCALISKKQYAARMLLNSDSAVNLQDENGQTPLHWAAKRGYVGIIKKLLDAGANTRHQDKKGQTPFFVALEEYMEGAANVLVAADSENDVPDGKGFTPLYTAIMRDFPMTVERQLFCDMHPHTKIEATFHRGSYPIDLAYVGEIKNRVAEKILTAIALWEIEIKYEEHPGLYPGITMYCKAFLKLCQAEVAKMKEAMVHGSRVSYFDLARKHVRKVALYLELESIRKHWEDQVENFPMYEDLIAFKVRRAQDWKILTAQCLECFTALSTKLPSLPEPIINIILGYLCERDMRVFVISFQTNNVSMNK